MKKRYWALLALLFLVGLDWYIRAPDSRSRPLAGVIEAQSYPASPATAARITATTIDTSVYIESTLLM